jgi:hypothetical protein
LNNSENVHVEKTLKSEISSVALTTISFSALAADNCMPIGGTVLANAFDESHFTNSYNKKETEK